MPLTYPRSYSARSSYLAHVSDADDSIVLSDIVRSGEVSRLRRRGAIAIRDMNVPQSPIPLPLNAPPTTSTSRHSSVSLPPLAPPNPELDLSETDDDDAEQRQGGVGRWFFRSRLNLREPPSTSDLNDPDPLLFPQEADVRIEEDDEDSSYVLFCGGKLRESDWYSSLDLPRSHDPPTRHRASAFQPTASTSRSSFPRARRTNGCGALIHPNAQPRRRQGTWVACGVAAETVVKMDARYFDCYATARMIKSACGCVREGVGCRVCGNPLGIIYVPCQAAADGLNISRAASSSSSSQSSTGRNQSQTHIQPPGPSYWLSGVGACQRRRHAPTPEVFNFFSERVRSAPEFTFPPLPPEELSSRTMQPLSPGALTTPSRRLSASSIPDAYASRQWTDRSSVPSVDSLQAPDSLWDNQPGEVTRTVVNTPQEDEGEGEGDSAEKPEDPVPNGGGRILWAER